MIEPIYTVRMMRDGDDTPVLTGLMSDTHCCCCGQEFERIIYADRNARIRCLDCERGAEMASSMPTEQEWQAKAQYINLDIMVFVIGGHEHTCWHIRQAAQDFSGMDGFIAKRRHQVYLDNANKEPIHGPHPDDHA